MRNPFIAGSWVRGDNFFGRASLLREILEGDRHSLWVVGARRIGKTSLLKELERRVQESSQTPFASLYWDLQGSADARGLADGLLDSIEDSEAFLRAADVSVGDVEGLSVTDMLNTLIRRTVRSGWRLLLLVDEAEELLTVARADPWVIPRLRRILQKGIDVRAVITSTKRLGRIDESPDLPTSPFLQGFVPALHLAPFSDTESRELLARGRFTEAEAGTMIERTGSHPFLLQYIASRLYESRDLDATLEQGAADEMIANFLSYDFHTLDSEDQRVIEAVARASSLTRAELSQALGRSEEALEPCLVGLRSMGHLKLSGGRYGVGNWFFARWLRRIAVESGDLAHPR